MPATLVQLPNDVIEVFEQRENIRIMVSIPGRYVLANKRNLKGERGEFACRIVNISPRAMALAAPVVGRPGERVIVYTDTFGTLQGAIIRAVTHGFVMTITASADEREKLEAKLAWPVKQKDTPELEDGRRSARIVPREPMAMLRLPDGTRASCLVIDVSRSGVAVSADFFPDLGAEVAVGQMRGRVVRLFSEGFAIEFIHHHDLAQVENLAQAESGLATD